MCLTAFIGYKAVLVSIAAAIAAVALFLTNLGTILKAIREFFSWLTNGRFDEPILLNLRSSLPLAGARDSEWLQTSDQLWETWPTLMDITISYEGTEKLVFHRLEIRHWAGLLVSTVTTGQLASKGKYQFSFGYDTHHKYDLDPPLVLDPSSESILRFEIKIAPEGAFRSTGGTVYTKLIYRTGKGRSGVLPLIQLDAAVYKNYPDVYRKIRLKRRVDFPIFESSNPVRYEKFVLTQTGAVKGKRLK